MAGNLQRQQLNPIEQALTFQKAFEAVLYTGNKELSIIIYKYPTYTGDVMNTLKMDKRFIMVMPLCCAGKKGVKANNRRMETAMRSSLIVASAFAASAGFWCRGCDKAAGESLVFEQHKPALRGRGIRLVAQSCFQK